jgi:hypothetical protein
LLLSKHDFKTTKLENRELGFQLLTLDHYWNHNLLQNPQNKNQQREFFLFKQMENKIGCETMLRFWDMNFFVF